jgi:hypothetical protein
MPTPIRILSIILVAILVSSGVSPAQSIRDRLVSGEDRLNDIVLPRTILIRPAETTPRNIPPGYRAIIDNEVLRIDRMEGLIEPPFMTALKKRVLSEDFIGIIGEYRSRNVDIAVVRYFVNTPDGPKPLVLHRYGPEYVFDGDLVVPPSVILFGVMSVEDLQARFAVFAATGTSVFTSGPLQALRWPDATIPYEFADDFCCRDLVETAIAQIHALSRMRMVERDGQGDYVKFVNAEPWTSSRTQLLRQPGENTVKIQPFRPNGTPVSDAVLVTNILHELGHEFGLIHEHTRSDRDNSIVRNPTCAPPDFLCALRSEWISLTNETFVDEGATLRSIYDFATIMHYNFGVNLDNVPGAECTSWVRRSDNCLGPTCRSSFRTDITWNTNDISGLEAFYDAVLPDDPNALVFSSENLRHRGKRIDKCLHAPFGAIVADRCGPNSQRLIANSFCRTQGFSASTGDIVVSNVVGIHSGLFLVEGWKDVAGTQVLHHVTCTNANQDTVDVASGSSENATFRDNNVNIRNRRIDRCMHGDGITGNRCSNANQQLIANNFCTVAGYDRATVFETAFGPGFGLAGFEPATGNFLAVSGLDVFSRITCIRPAT